MPETKKEDDSLKKLKAHEKKWGRETIGLGWTAIPNLLLERQQALKIDPKQC